jgi:hypothetical protein
MLMGVARRRITSSREVKVDELQIDTPSQCLTKATAKWFSPIVLHMKCIEGAVIVAVVEEAAVFVITLINLPHPEHPVNKK